MYTYIMLDKNNLIVNTEDKKEQKNSIKKIYWDFDLLDLIIKKSINQKASHKALLDVVHNKNLLINILKKYDATIQILYTNNAVKYEVKYVDKFQEPVIKSDIVNGVHTSWFEFPKKSIKEKFDTQDCTFEEVLLNIRKNISQTLQNSLNKKLDELTF